MTISISRFWLLGLAAALILSACGRDGAERTTALSASEVPEAERYGGTAVIGATVDMSTLNVLASREGISRMVGREVLFAPLVKYDAQWKPIPWLAERWDTVRISPDTLELTFHLRKDVRWHDGEPTTAADVLFTFERALDPRTAYMNASDFALYDPRATLVDPHTIKFRLRPHKNFLAGWVETPPLPQHILGEIPPEQLANHPFGPQQPVGNGPFRFVRRTPNQEWVFEANPDFPEALGGRPYVDRLDYRVIPDATTLLTELLTGGADVMIGAPRAEARRLQQTPGVRLIAYPDPTWYFLAWNTRRPMFDTPGERRALTRALDRRTMVDALWYGNGTVGRSTVTPLHWSYNAEDPETRLPYAPAEARRLLAEAGWRDRDGDGIVEDAQGRPFRFTLKFPAAGGLWQETAEVAQAQLARVGVSAELQPVEGNTFIQQIEGHVNRRGERERDFEAFILALTDDARKDDSQLFHSRALDDPRQWTGFSNPRADVLLDTLAAVGDQEAARSLWQEYQRLMVREAPVSVLFYGNKLIGVRTRLQGVEADGRRNLSNIARWWILPGERSAPGP